jgi:hypothetical protein
MTRSRRGQNLVLLALTLLFLALMVTMTIGLGLRIRQRHELQNVADAAAFSNAVMTARAFNNMAAVNRLEVSYWVSLAADESLISWTGYARAMANGASIGAATLRDDRCVDAETRRQLDGFRSRLSTFIDARLKTPAWTDMDRAAGKEALAIQGQIGALRSELSDGLTTRGDGDLQDRLLRRVRTQALTRRILDATEQPDLEVLDVDDVLRDNSAPGVSLRELDCEFGTSLDPLDDRAAAGSSGLCLRGGPSGSWSENMLHAAMGTRGAVFLVGRPDVPPLVQAELARLDADYDRISVSSGGKAGSAYWDSFLNHGRGADREEAWADDHGDVVISTPRCSYSQPITAHVRSTHEDDDDDQHAYEPFGGPEERLPDKFHTMGSCQPFCPSVWVRTIGFKPSDREADAWGQPKVLVALQRLPRLTRFPWELRFAFPFAAGGAARGWDGTGQRLHARGAEGDDVSRQVAVATGIVYYHRKEHWDEFPNLLNPFWRATLAPLDVDDLPQDLRPALTPPGQDRRRFVKQLEAVEALQAAGYEGLH